PFPPFLIVFARVHCVRRAFPRTCQAIYFFLQRLRMDVPDVQVGQLRVVDEVGARCQKLFQDFLEEFKEEGTLKYVEAVKDCARHERSSLEISLEDVEKYNQSLNKVIIEDYYR
ncbi:DNA replication licensing factor Mcm6, partial [Gryllus bimaculatus]